LNLIRRHWEKLCSSFFFVEKLRNQREPSAGDQITGILKEYNGTAEFLKEFSEFRTELDRWIQDLSRIANESESLKREILETQEIIKRECPLKDLQPK
jgi:chromosome segregation ATPase